MKVNILGTEWTLASRSEEEEPRLKDCSGFADWTSRLIVVIQGAETNLDKPDILRKKIIRHEIVHAFLIESGLDQCSTTIEGWATNEEMVDWIARQGLKIFKAWQEAGAV